MVDQHFCFLHSYNGSLPNGDRGRRRSRFALFKRPKANGVKPSTVHSTCSPQTAKVHAHFPDNHFYMSFKTLLLIYMCHIGFLRASAQAECLNVSCFPYHSSLLHVHLKHVAFNSCSMQHIYFILMLHCHLLLLHVVNLISEPYPDFIDVNEMN